MGCSWLPMEPAPLDDRRGSAARDTLLARELARSCSDTAPDQHACTCRVPLSKQEKSRLKSARRAGMAGGALLDDFADEIGHLVQASHLGHGLGPLSSSKRLSSASWAARCMSGWSRLHSARASPAAPILLHVRPVCSLDSGIRYTAAQRPAQAAL